MKINTTTTYVTNDGKIFTNKSEAEKYEASLNVKIKAFKVRHHPDLTEGRGMQAVSYILVHANGRHEMFAEHKCYEIFGNKVAFCMGVYGSNAIIPNWALVSIPFSEVPEGCMANAIKLEERFVDKLWEDSEGGL